LADLPFDPSHTLVDLISGKSYTRQSILSMRLRPYQVAWITNQAVLS
jgi:hypothetical protein